MNRFKVGDRIVLTERAKDGDPSLIGKEATVLEMNPYSNRIDEEHFSIKWDDKDQAEKWLARSFDLAVNFVKDSLYA